MRLKKHYWKCNFPIIVSSVRLEVGPLVWLVRLSVIIFEKGGMLHFHAPIAALVKSSNNDFLLSICRYAVHPTTTVPTVCPVLSWARTRNSAPGTASAKVSSFIVLLSLPDRKFTDYFVCKSVCMAV